MIEDLAKPKPKPKYGLCRWCQSPVEIPGLDAYKCPKCGWVVKPEKPTLESCTGLTVKSKKGNFKK